MASCRPSILGTVRWKLWLTPSHDAAAPGIVKGTILFPPLAAGPLYRISDTGGVAVPVTRIQQGRGEGHSHPFFLPDGKHFLYFVRSDDPQGSGIYIGSLDSSASVYRSHWA